MTLAQAPSTYRRWIVLAVLCAAQLMVVLDATIVNIALPSAQRALRFSDDNRQWVITAYSLSFGSLLLLGGKLSDLFGRKWTFIVGLVGFAVASAAGGAAESFGALTAARACQGAFGALLAPAALSLVATTFTDAKQRNTAFGIYSAVTGSGASLGLLLGGALTEYLTWRYCMYVNLVFALVAVVGALVLLENHAPAHRTRLDLPGTIAVSAGLFALVYGFSNTETASWTAPMTIAGLVAGVSLLALFISIERRAASPLLPLRVLADRNRAGSFVAMLLGASAMFGVFLFLTFYLQEVRGYSPLTTGLAFLPSTAAVMLAAVVANVRLRARLGPRVLAVTGMALGTVAMLLLAQIDAQSSYLTGVLPGLVVVGTGLGLIFSTALNGSSLGVRPDDAGVASATVSACQQVGGSLGTALLSSLAASAATSFVADAGTAPTPALLRQAAVHGYTTAFEVSAGLFALGAVLTGVLFARRVAEVPRGATPPTTIPPPAAVNYRERVA